MQYVAIRKAVTMSAWLSSYPFSHCTYSMQFKNETADLPPVVSGGGRQKQDFHF